MPLYQSPPAYIHRALVKAASEGKDSAETRLEIDLADILTGPTSAHNARHLAESILHAGGYAVVEALEAACKRFRGEH